MWFILASFSDQWRNLPFHNNVIDFNDIFEVQTTSEHYGIGNDI